MGVGGKNRSKWEKREATKEDRSLISQIYARLKLICPATRTQFYALYSNSIIMIYFVYNIRSLRQCR